MPFDVAKYRTRRVGQYRNHAHIRKAATDARIGFEANLLASNAELARRLDELESKYPKQFRVVFEAIRQLMAAPVRDRKEIGFRSRSVKT